jgi:hypothetical protein
MTWLNAWAWIGLVVLVVPVLIHLLGRRSARVQRFPTLRFIDQSPLMAVRRTRLSDLPLLIARVAILAAAVAAVAHPLVLTAERERDLGRALARAIIVDTGASMLRAMTAGAGGERAIDRARRDAERFASEARTTTRLETSEPGQIVAGAAGWLGTQAGRRELIIISDFQLGAIDSADLAAIGPEMGVRLERMPIQPTSTPIDVPMAATVADAIARVVTTSDRIDVEWIAPPAPPSLASDGLLVLAAEGERARADAARRAAGAISAASVPADRPAAIVSLDFEGRATLAREAGPLTHPWQGDIVARLRRDPTLAAAAATAQATGDSTFDAEGATKPFTVVARTAGGDPVVVAGNGRIASAGDARDRLILFSRVDAGSLASAALIAALSRAAGMTPDVAELDPAMISDVVLAGWQRDAAPSVAAGPATEADMSDGRWFWGLALGLLGLESWMRRTRRKAAGAEGVHERAA